MQEASPKEERCSGRGVDVGEVRNDYQHSEGGEVLDHVEVSSVGALGPCRWRWGMLRVVQCCDESLALDAFKYIRQPEHDAKKGAPS